MAFDEKDLQAILAERGLRVESQPIKGRCLFAARNFSRGDIIIDQHPFVSVLDESSLRKRCDSCFQAFTNLKRCSACKATWYCSSTCQSKGWKIHQQECKAIVCLKEEKQQTPTATLRLMLRLLIKRNLQDEGVIMKSTTDNYTLVELLPSHMTDINEKQLVLYAQMANLINIIRSVPYLNLKEIAQNFSRFACNAHTICDSELRPMGTGLYPVISIINHSCMPNAVLLFDGNHATVRAIEPINAGSELTLAYIDIAASTASRKKTLLEQYFFDCKCVRCLKVHNKEGQVEDAILEGFRCPKEQCEGPLLYDSEITRVLVCQSCGQQENEELKKRQAKINEKKANEASKALSDGNILEAKHLYEDLVNIQVSLWHPHSVHIMRTRDSLLKICMELQNWKEALNYCRLTLPGYERAYPSFHPIKGLQYYTCGKLEWFLENTMEALRFLLKSSEILVVTHGRDSEFVKELLSRIEEARAEAVHLNAFYDSG